MRLILLFIVIVTGHATHAEDVLARLECAARLEDATVDPGSSYTHDVFKKFYRDGWDGLTRLGGFAVLMAPRWSSGDDEVMINEVLAQHLNLLPQHGWRLTTAVERWGRAARIARSNSRRVRRRRVTGSAQILALLNARAERGRELQREFDGGPVAQPSRPALRTVLGDAAAAATATGLLGTLTSRGLSISSFLDSPLSILRAGALAVIVPIAVISLERIFVHVKQALRNRDRWPVIKYEEPTRVDDADYLGRVKEMLDRDDRGAYLYRGTRTRVDSRRTESFDPRPLLPRADEIVRAAVATKGQAPTVDRRVVESDEIIFFDLFLNNWVLIGLDHAPSSWSWPSRL